MRASSILLCGILAARLLAAAPTGSEPSEDTRFQALIDRIWAWDMDQFPEWATNLGKRTGLDRWTDNSETAIEERDAQTRRFLGDLEKIDAKRLSEKWRTDYDLLLLDHRRDVEGQRFPGELLALDQLGGVHQSLAELMQIVPAQRAEDFDAILARLRSFPKLVDQNIALLQRGLAAGVTPPRVTLRDVPRQIDALTAQDSLENPILTPFRADAPLLTKEQREHYRTEGLRVFRESVLPALKKFRAFVGDTYLPGARRSFGMSALPDGQAWYAFAAKESTTTDLTPKEIHRIGLDEVARIQAGMEAVMHRTGFKGDLKAFGEFLRSDPRFFYKSPEELLAGYRDICKRADAELPRFFGRLPRLTYGVLAVPDYAAESKPAAYYESGSLEAGRPGYFRVNTSHFDKRPKWQMETLALHESVPGHHLQIALAQELDEKPELLRERGYTAYIEGWGLYCEWLGTEMGFYKDPYADFGRLTFEMWRAARLVVDTGLHAFGWSRERAIAYLREHTALSESNIEVEVDRYLVWPGQALAYKVGQLKILELRRRAESALGEKFDVRAFHDVVLGDGAVPLSVLERRVDDWVAARRDKSP